MMYKEEKCEETKRRISSLASFSPAFRDLWEFRSLTPHAYFEPKGSYDRCTVLTRKRWMLLEEKRIGLSSQKMRARGEKKGKMPLLCTCHSAFCATLKLREKEKRKRESKRIMMYHNSLFHSWDDFQRELYVFFCHRVTYLRGWIFTISLSYANTYTTL